MTQKELDALMAKHLDSEELNVYKIPNESDYKFDAFSKWPPAPSNDDYKVVYQLDNVTKESEEKATQIFDIIENVSDSLMKEEKNINFCLEVLEKNTILFSKLIKKAPDIQKFQVANNKNENAISKMQEVFTTLQDSSNAAMDVMDVMDIMQYQDIHRQKIERVINVSRALTNYLDEMFVGKIDDRERVGSANHIHGDKTTDDIASIDEIEILLAKFSGKKAD